MSSIYNLEPPTKGKVILKTNLGDLEIELWAKEAPKACRNFVQLCMEGYYDNTIFHRIIKDYMVQGGDPSGTGEGSESIYGELFKDEFHTRLKFSHRGLLACANQNKPNSNGSQFFITLEKTDWLERQNTIFGKIVGDTIYNLLRIGETATDDNDRPLEPPVLLETDVVWNPFDDIIPRRDVQREREEFKRKQEEEASKAAKQKIGRTNKKNLGLLSFGEEAEEEDQQLEGSSLKIKSAHDALDDHRLAKAEETPAEELIVVERSSKRSREELETVERALNHTRSALASRSVASGLEPKDEGPSSKSFSSTMHDRMMEKRVLMKDGPKAPSTNEAIREIAEAGSERILPSGDGPMVRFGTVKDQKHDDDDDDDNDDGDDDDEGGSPKKKDFQRERNERIEELRVETKRQGIGRMSAPDEVENADLLKPWQLAREQYKQRKRMVGDREKATMARLKQFAQTLKASNNGVQPKQQADVDCQDPDKAMTEGEGYNGKIRNDIDHKAYLPPSWRVDDYLDRPDLDASLGDLSTHTLKFTKLTGRVDDMARDVTANGDDYVVYDPLLEKGKGKFSKAEQGKKKRQNEWTGRANV